MHIGHRVSVAVWTPALGLLLITAAAVRAAIAPEDAFQYNIINVSNTAPGERPTVTYSVTDPTRGNATYDILTHPAFVAPNGVSRLAVLLGWDTRDYTNTGSGVVTGAALPISIDALARSVPNGDGTFSVTSLTPLPASASGTGVAAIEGHPAADLDGDGLFESPVQERSVFRFFPITDTAIVPRRTIVEISKCTQCHTPHLSLHGSNRTDEPQVCAICHNPNQTDIPFRTAGAETPIDFKHMVHAIHSASIRRTPFVVIGRNGSVNDYSHVVFRRNLRNCLNCHVDGTFELPLAPGVLGTTMATGSSYGPPKVVDTNPANDLKITPIASVCSACHDDSKTRQHMLSAGARFGVLQAAIDSGAVRERCVNCHGPGRNRDVRKEHGLGATDDN
jgi:OmcA/MtrC family decaheme c-type cytochrome